MQQYGKLIIMIGVAVLVIGAVVYLFGDKLGWIGNLPGDIRYEGEHTKVYFPVMTMIIVSIVINLILYIIRKF